MSAYDTDSQRWQAIIDRDAQADTHFLYGVLSTGIYCYPSCPSRLAHRDHTRFYENRDQAQQDGLRACQRCHPDQPPLLERQRQLVERACHSIAAASEPVKVAQLACELGISRFHLQKLFKQFLGLSPKQYIQAVRARHASEKISQQSSVTRAWLDAGYDSSSSYYADGAARLGMRARDYQRQGKGLFISYAFGCTRFGQIIVATTQRGICSVLFGDTQATLTEELTARFRQATLQQDRDGLQSLVQAVVDGIENPVLAEQLPLDIRGTAFQERVWEALRRIGPGDTASYADIAREIGEPTAARAVARACSSNPLAVLVPCHRVVASDGSISGYRWGKERKRQLLAHEKAQH